MHEPILFTKRCDLIDTCFYGSYFLASFDGIYKQKGTSKKDICFMRSLAKPLQASILADCNIVKKYKLEPSELAIMCASHAGSKKHIEILKNILNKTNLSEADLELAPQNPLDMREFDGNPTKLHNNCSGKHLMMALVAKDFCYPKNYCSQYHEVQRKIKAKQEELSGYKSDYLTFDGCGTPLWGLPYEKIIEAYFNFFHDKKYNFLTSAILNNSEIYGGYDRLDSEIIQQSNKKLFAKVGAGGLILIYNIKKDEILLIKLAQDNNPIRKLVTLKILNDLKWLKNKVEFNIYNQKQQIVANYDYIL